MASGVIALSALGYLIGWEEARAYFSALGASWAVPMLPPLHLLQMSSPIILPMALSVLLSIERLAQGETTTRKLSRAAVINGVVVIALFAIELLPEKWVSPVVGYWCSFVGAIFYAIMAGQMIALLIAQ